MCTVSIPPYPTTAVLPFQLSLAGGPWVFNQQPNNANFVFVDADELRLYPRSAPTFRAGRTASTLLIRGVALENTDLLSMPLRFAAEFYSSNAARPTEPQSTCLNHSVYYATRFGLQPYESPADNIVQQDRWGCNDETLLCTVFEKNVSVKVAYFRNCSLLTVTPTGVVLSNPDGGIAPVGNADFSLQAHVRSVDCALQQRQSLYASLLPSFQDAADPPSDTLWSSGLPRAESLYLLRADTLVLDLGLEAGSIIVKVMFNMTTPPGFEVFDLAVEYALVDPAGVPTVAELAAWNASHPVTFVDAGAPSLMSWDQLHPVCETRLPAAGVAMPADFVPATGEQSECELVGRVRASLPAAARQTWPERVRRRAGPSFR